jgi:hypothetical protein
MLFVDDAPDSSSDEVGMAIANLEIEFLALR